MYKLYSSYRSVKWKTIGIPMGSGIEWFFSRELYRNTQDIIKNEARRG